MEDHLHVHTVLYDDAEDQDFIGPITVFGVLEGVRHTYVTAEGPRTVTTASGAEITVRAPWSPGSADLILVPGGGYGEGSGVECQIARGTLPQALAEAVRPGLVLAAVCTGTLLLAAAGLTKGRPCTTHHIALDDVRALGGDLVRARVVDDGDLVTSGGVTSGLDLGLWLTERFHGPQAALLAEEVLEYERRGTVWHRRQE
ncbi:DJ-1/PfpI family protein [Nonomuraea sp. NPDC050404]|uniref:DJ-1/PfpI family protein n=1 Tax=Nonomuraea sp. NPDC050404 TaxID=3155783 RepID=UPI0033D842C7